MQISKNYFRQASVFANLFSMIKDRIIQIIESKGIAKESFYTKIGMTSASFRGKAKSMPLNSNAIENILSEIPDLNAEWLLTGKGSMLKESSQAISTPTINYEYKGAPYYNVDFIGGFDLVLNDQTINPDYYINFEPYNKPGVVWCNITGHSMEPELSNGDYIALKEMTDPVQYLLYGEIYAIVTESYRTVKRIGKAEQKDFIRLIPTNKSPEYSPQDIPISMIQKVYAVLGSMHRLF